MFRDKRCGSSQCHTVRIVGVCNDTNGTNAAALVDDAKAKLVCKCASSAPAFYTPPTRRLRRFGHTSVSIRGRCPRRRRVFPFVRRLRPLSGLKRRWQHTSVPQPDRSRSSPRDPLRRRTPTSSARCCVRPGPPGPRRPKVPSCLLYTSPSPRDGLLSRMPSSA